MNFDLSVRGLLPVVLFVVLSPGLLLTIPGSGSGMNAVVNFASGKTTVMAILVHAVVFFVALSLLKSVV